MHIADLHCDTISKLYRERQEGRTAELCENQFQVDVEKLRRGGCLFQNFALFVDKGKEKNPYLCAKGQLALFREQMQENQAFIRQAGSVSEIMQNQKEGLMSAVLTLEEGEICEGSLDKLEEFYRAGARMMTFTWNYDNSLGGQGGLTELGIAFLAKMEELGMIADVSHLPDAGFWDVCRYAKKPFVASHSNARSLCAHKRNLTDGMIREIANCGGVIGINFYGLFLEDDAPHKSSVARIADHILHMIQTGGMDCVALGSDFDGFCGETEVADYSRMELLDQELKKRGLPQSAREAVFYQNALRVYQSAAG